MKSYIQKILYNRKKVKENILQLKLYYINSRINIYFY
jgi:hypothetical protein